MVRNKNRHTVGITALANKSYLIKMKKGLLIQKIHIELLQWYSLCSKPLVERCLTTCVFSVFCYKYDLERALKMSPDLSQITMHLLVVVAWAFIGVSLTTAMTIKELSLEDDGESERIIGGSRAAPGQFPYAVSLYFTNIFGNPDFICTASIISPTTILTAAGCVVLFGSVQPAERFHLIANVTSTSPKLRINVTEVISHENYSVISLENDTLRMMENDIAILKTEEIPFGNEVGPVCIARGDTEPMQYESATAMGWGQSFRWFALSPVDLHFAEQTIVRNSICKFYNPFVSEDNICARGPGEQRELLRKGVCDGDFGGPLVHLSDDQPPVEIGIASYVNGRGCGTKSPAVFTRVSSYYDWIMEAAGDTPICVV